MAKLLWLLFLLAVAIRMITGRWPWDILAAGRIPPAERRARALLGISGTLTRDGILNAHRRLIARVHPDRGGSVEQAREANAARDLLLERLDRTSTGPDKE